MSRNLLLDCGLAAAVLYALMTLLVPLGYEGYDPFSQVVSELSAVGAPTQALWNRLVIPYVILMTAFGWGVWRSAGESRRLRVAGGLLMLHATVGLAWPLGPMHQREVLAAGGGNWTDTLHLVLSAVTVPSFMLAVGFGAGAFGRGFRVFSIGSLAVMLAAAVIMGRDMPKLQANLPTPFIGLWERLIIAAFLAWVVVVSVTLQQRARPHA